ncbi:hypothetical protein ACRALDRAFT_1060550 [Sodiomyces alcalophilus JCM 7366]|uniref:uncharacterized protein n=1 Tax=Sodiomyces alcalophilus JCM 7366 TaxID=591952 RepID=UPI0039B436A5
MSRAIEKEVAASLKNGDHVQVFREISRALTQHRGPELLEIEILGRSHPVPAEQVLLQDHNAIGVPKLRLVQAFIVARQILGRHRVSYEALTPEAAAELDAATAVLLLMDAEHLTAANTRKRILSTALTSAGHDDGKGRRSYLDRERIFVDSLLTSRLHRHTKSPNLWSHRRWLMEQYRASRLPVDVLAGIQVVATSGERHPRNYYAWCHARWLVKAFREDLDEAERRGELWERIVSWSYSHHDDVSGWSFLDHLGTRGFAGGGDDNDDSARLATFSRTLDLVTKFGWANESVWWYLRTTAASMPLTPADRDAFRSVHRNLLRIAQGASAVRDVNVLDSAWRWYEQNRIGTAGG